MYTICHLRGNGGRGAGGKEEKRMQESVESMESLWMRERGLNVLVNYNDYIIESLSLYCRVVLYILIFG